ncbi:MAG: DNA repair protein RecN [Spirosomataceae bacterium]|jgi:DNA repair protein RecN (Recombination protein N)
MLSSLLIKNYALIRHLEIQPENGLNVITGETGAGKSIMLGALGLLMGNRADVKVLFEESEKCIVEGTFDIERLNLKTFFEENELDYEPHCVIRREILPAGKSRAFVNDSPVTLDSLKELGVKLMDIHSQNETLQLGSNIFQLNLVDSYAANTQFFEDYKIAYTEYKQAEKQLQTLKENSVSLKKEFEYNSFLFEELNALKPENIDQAELESELLILENAEEVKRKLSIAFESLANTEISGLNLVRDAGIALGNISSFSEKYKNLKDRINSTLLELQDIVHEIETEASNVETDNQKTDFLKDKLNGLYRLQQKHGVDNVEQLVTLKNELSTKIEQVINLDEDLQKLEKETTLKLENLQKKASELTKNRLNIVKPLESQIVNILIELGIPEARLEINFKDKKFSPDGADDINFAFSANKGANPKPLKDVASGGEFSRVMLALKYILAEKKQLPTIIFDEIDTGISGEVAIKMGNILQEMSGKLQVIAITHLHQIAGKGSSHFYVYKDNSDTKTVSLMRKLSGDERIIEIAKMIGGQNPSESAIRSAIEILGNI